MKTVEGWQPKSLRQLTTINYGRSPAGILAEDGEYPVVGTGGTERVGNDYLYEGDSIILGRKGTIDRVYFATGRFWTIDTAYYLSAFDEALPRWLFYFLQTLDLRQMNEATGVPSLSREVLYKIAVPTPPQQEQAKIAEILSTVDRAIEQTEALIAKQQRIKTGMMQDLLTRGIDEHGNLRSEQTHAFKDSPLGRIPVEWEVVSLQSLASRHKHAFVDGPFGSNLKTIHYRDSGFPIIQSGFVTGGVFSADTYLYVEESKFKAEIRSKAVPGDIVMAKIGARCGTCAILPDGHPVSIIAGNCIKISVSADNSNEYVLACLQHEYSRTQFEDFISTTAQPAINMPALKAMPVKRPSRNEQLRIVTCLDSSHRELEEHQRRVMKLVSLKSALMQDLLTGRKRVTSLLEMEPKREKIYAQH
jgi:type I restriction enzyme S subunit